MWVDCTCKSDVLVLADKLIPSNGVLKASSAASLLLKCMKHAYKKTEQCPDVKRCLAGLKMLSTKLEVDDKERKRQFCNGSHRKAIKHDAIRRDAIIKESAES